MSKKSQTILTINTILCFIGLCGIIISLFSGNLMLYKVFQLLLFGFVLFYVFLGFNKPHGNLLKYMFFALIFIFGFKLFYAVKYAAENGLVWIYCGVLLMCILSYVSGRLNKVKKNLVLLLIGLALEIAMVVDGILIKVDQGVGFFDYFTTFSSFILYINIMVIYLLRANEHLEAGKNN